MAAPMQVDVAGADGPMPAQPPPQPGIVIVGDKRPLVDATNARKAKPIAEEEPVAQPRVKPFHQVVKQWTNVTDCQQWIQDNRIDPKVVSFRLVRDYLIVQRRHLELLHPHDTPLQNRCEIARALSEGDTIVQRANGAAARLLPHLQAMGDHFCAMKGHTGSRPVAHESETVNVPESGVMIKHLLSEISAPVKEYEGLRTTIAHCESAKTIAKLVTYCKAQGLDATTFQHGNIAMAPTWISAPPRKGKTTVTLGLLWLARRMGIVCTYGVAPNTNAVINEVHTLLNELGWWDNPCFLGKSLSLTHYASDSSKYVKKGYLHAVPADEKQRFDFLLYSSDNKRHSDWIRSYVNRRRVLLKPLTTDELESEHDDGLRSEIDAAELANGHTDSFAHFRDEAQNAARLGAEKEIGNVEKYSGRKAKLEEVIRDLQAIIDDPQQSEQRKVAAEAQRKDASAQIADVSGRLAKAERAKQKKLGSSQENLRATFVNSWGYQVLISATLLPTLQEMQLYGTLWEKDLPPELYFSQDRHFLPPLVPSMGGQYVGITRMADAKYLKSTGYTASLVRSCTVLLLKDRYAHMLAQLRISIDSSVKTIRQLTDADGLHDDDAEVVAQRERQSKLIRLSTEVTQRLTSVNQDVPPASDDVFADPQFASEGVLALDGGQIYAKAQPRAAPSTRILRTLAMAARGLAWIKAYIGQDGRLVDRLVVPKARSSVLEDLDASEEAKQKAEAIPCMLPVTLVCAHPTTIPTANALKAHHDDTKLCGRKQTQFDWIMQLITLCRQQKQSAIIAHWASGVTRQRIEAAFQMHKKVCTFSSECDDSPWNAQRPVTLFEIGPSETDPSVYELKPLPAPVADMDGVVDLLKRKTFKAASRTHIFAVGYDMFNGALTLTRRINIDDILLEGDDGTEERRVSVPVLVCPQRILFAHSGVRAIDSIYQIVGRTYNDLSFDAPEFRIEILTYKNTRGNLVAYANAEAKLSGVLGQAFAGSPMQWDAIEQHPEAFDDPLDPLDDDYDDDDLPFEDDDGNVIERPAKRARGGGDAIPAEQQLDCPLRPLPYVALGAAKACFVYARELANQPFLRMTNNTDDLVLGRRRMTVGATVAGGEDTSFEELMAKRSAFLKQDEWLAEDDDEDNDDDNDDDDDSVNGEPALFEYDEAEHKKVMQRFWEVCTHRARAHENATSHEGYVGRLKASLIRKEWAFPNDMPPANSDRRKKWFSDKTDAHCFAMINNATQTQFNALVDVFFPETKQGSSWASVYEAIKNHVFAPGIRSAR